jgi:hypothetical protein
MAITKTVNLDVQSNLDESTKSVGSLKAQLREAQSEVAALSDKFGATSQQAIEAAKRASELKDRIGDAKALTDAFNPDAKFAALSSSLAGVAGGFSAVTGAIGLLGVESKQVEEQILKVQSAMAIASGLQQLGESADAFKQMKAVAIDAFKGIKAAIGSTGIGLFVVALGTIYEYWDDIKEAVSGVSEQQLRLNDISQRNVDQAEEKLKTITAQDNILKLQGKSEKEILAIKIKQTDEAITATKINIENQKTTNKLAEIGAKRNYEMLKSYIDFISAPVRFLYETATSAINKIINLINKIPGIDIKANIDEKFGDKAADYIAKLGFDPAKVKSEGDATVKASQDTLNRLLNDRAGYVLASQAIDKQGLDKPKSEDDKTTKKETEKLERVEELTSLKTHEDEKFKIIQDGLTKKTEALKNDAAASLEIERLKQEGQIALAKKTSEMLGAFTDLLGKETAEGKALAIAQATINAYLGISEVWKAKNIYPEPFGTATKIASTVVIAASAFKTVKDIAAVQVPGGGGGGGVSAPAGGGSAPAAPSFNVVGAGGTNQLAQVMNNQGMPPVQAYVVASNVTSAQSLNRNIVNNATLG